MPKKKQHLIKPPKGNLQNLDLSIYDNDLDLLEELIQEEMYTKSEQSLYSFFINFWNTFSPEPLQNGWFQQCVCEHVQAALERKIRRLVINCPPRIGKTVWESTLVRLSDGTQKRIKDIRVGDKVLSFNIQTGKHEIKKVINHWDNGIEDFYKITLKNGAEVITTKDHRFYTWQGYRHVRDLQIGDDISVAKNISILLDKTYQSISEEEARAIAFWMAEGEKTLKTNQYRVTNCTEDLINQFKKDATLLGYTYTTCRHSHAFKGRSLRFNNQYSFQWLKSYFQEFENLYGRITTVNLGIPNIIFNQDINIQSTFLGMFIAADGYILNNKNNHIGITLKSEHCINDLFNLCLIMGFKPFKYSYVSRQNNEIYYVLLLRGKHNIELAKLLLKDKLYHKNIKLNNLEIKKDNRDDFTIPSNWVENSEEKHHKQTKFKYTKNRILKYGHWTTLHNVFNNKEILPSKEVIKKISKEEEWQKIVSIEYVGKHRGFDIEVEDNNNFVLANGIHSHNSTIASISAPVWHWLKHPEEKFWLVSHSEKLYAQNIGYARKILDHPTYKNRWCNPKEDEYYSFSLEGVDRVTRVENSEGGYLLGGSPGAKVLGMGYSVAILDDLLDSQESNSKEAVDGVNSWYTQTFLNRSNDVNNDVIILIMQRLHELDITDYVMKTYPEQNWFLLNLPAKYDPTRTFISPIGFNDRRTKRNQLLDPVRLPDHFLVTQSKNPIIYNTRYQQDPYADGDGNLVKAEWIQESAIKPLSYSVMIIVWDLNITDTPESDHTVGLVIGKHEDEYHIIDMWRKQTDIPQQVDAIRKMHKKYPKAIVGVEARANGHAAMSLLKREIPEIYAFEPRKFGGKKEKRLGSILPYFRDKKVFIYNPFTEDNKIENTYSANQIIKELKGFPIASSDDIVDCIAYGIAYLAEYGQENTAVITNGNKITVFDEDYMEERQADRISKMNLLNYEFSQENIPTRDFIQNLNW